MGNRLVQFLVVGALLIAAIKLFKWEQQYSENVLTRVRQGIKGRDPEQLLVAAGLTMFLGVVAVIAAQAFRKVA
jgi:hypothetical protein